MSSGAVFAGRTLAQRFPSFQAGMLDRGSRHVSDRRGQFIDSAEPFRRNGVRSGLVGPVCPEFAQLVAVLPGREFEPAPAGAKEAALIGETQHVGRLRDRDEAG